MLLKSQRNQLFQALLDKELQPIDFIETSGDYLYRLSYKEQNDKLQFEISYGYSSDASTVTHYVVKSRPGHENLPNNSATWNVKEWGNSSSGVFFLFLNWVSKVKREIEASDLWLESTKALQFFASVDTPVADRFTIAELGAVQGQLNILSKSFSTSELPAEAKQRLAEIAQTAMLKAETLTKKDWQYWIQGAFSSTVTSLELTEAQIQEVVALIRLAFGGLFLQA